MSFLGSFFKKSKLDAAIKQVRQARKNEGAKADQLYSTAYKGFAEVLAKDLLFSETLYNWGFALLHQGKTKSGDEAISIFEDALSKFNFCLTVDPDFLGAAIDGGFTYMELARTKGVPPSDKLYELAKKSFLNANRIQKGTASYNLACIYALRNENEECLKALDDSDEHGSLPSIEDILNDPDLNNIKSHQWFTDLIEGLKVKEAEAAEDAVYKTEAALNEEKAGEEEPQVSASVEPPKASADSKEKAE
ncbi:hypothetical protein GO003_011305 [Methylicorpusculum oleiharenae]|uniref:TPR end-of-group domain-containing protein n=1 Tax=Methylicorpusculum oleiharenae TaxID=1338687 RepID=UPI001359F18C|nr:hypothetical protein [Methylicorpusculum oleiharenae]MCD2450981.1 hypothetical protein [Methylicorpusculum oleiharenae]